MSYTIVFRLSPGAVFQFSILKTHSSAPDTYCPQVGDRVELDVADKPSGARVRMEESGHRSIAAGMAVDTHRVVFWIVDIGWRSEFHDPRKDASMVMLVTVSSEPPPDPVAQPGSKRRR